MSLELAEMLHLLEKYGCTPLTDNETRELEQFIRRKTRDQISDKLAREFWMQYLNGRKQ